MVFTRKDGDFHGRTVSFREGIYLLICISSIVLQFIFMSFGSASAKNSKASEGPILPMAWVSCSGEVVFKLDVIKQNENQHAS